MATLATALVTTPHQFLVPPTALHEGSLDLISTTLNPVASELRSLHQERIAAQRALRKRRRDAPVADDINVKKRRREDLLAEWNEEDAIRLGAIHTKGFEADQVWEQVRRVVDSIGKEAERDLLAREKEASLPHTVLTNGNVDPVERADSSPSEDDQEVSGISDNDDEELGEEGLDYEVEGIDDDEDARPSDSEEEDAQDQDEDDGVSDEAMDEDSLPEVDATEVKSDLSQQDGPKMVKDANGLNDGFFSIDDFNRQSGFLENADARGEDDGAASDEEEVDWAADPLSGGGEAAIDLQPKKKLTDDDEAGPTFGDMDLDAPEGASDEDDEDELEGGELDAMDDGTNANNIMYADFFAPPATKTRKNKKGRPHPHNFPDKPVEIKQNPPNDELENEEEDDTYNESNLSRVHRDMFSDDEVEDEAPSDEEALELRPSQQNLSSHEKRQLALQKEIRQLESTLISAKPWAMTGEASSSSRPLNSLLEEDLAFERAGKPVPVITAEISSSIDDLIKARIVAQDFQDILRRRPDDLATGSSKRELFNLPDQKSNKGLAEMYEEDHLRRTTGASKEDREISEKERKEQAEILALWTEVRGQLDSLSNFTLRPKAPTQNLEIRTDLPVARMEDARPAVAGAADGGMGSIETSQLAPGEIYAFGTGAEKEAGERVLGGKKGEIVGDGEMAREDSKRMRRRAKVRARKRGQIAPVKSDGKPKTRREGEKEVLGQLKKGGVKVFGKKGDVTDVEGRKVDGQKAVVGAGAYKL